MVVERETGRSISGWNFSPTRSRPSRALGRGQLEAQPVINARIETLDSNGLFTGAFAESRAILTAAGYYEWRVGADGRKDPFFIHQPDESMSFAAIVRAWRNREKSDDDPVAWLLSMAIITMDAHAAPGEVHDRQAAFLVPETTTTGWETIWAPRS